MSSLSNFSKFTSKEINVAICLLILAICGNFIAETFGCKTQLLLNNSMYAKHAILIFILYFVLDFTAGINSGNLEISPHETLKMVLVIYVLFLAFTKMPVPATILAFSLFMFLYFLNNYLKYYKNKFEKKKNEKGVAIVNKIDKLQYIIYAIIVLTIIIGFTKYFFRKRAEYGNEWSTATFIFGVKKCKSAI